MDTVMRNGNNRYYHLELLARQLSVLARIAASIPK